MTKKQKGKTTPLNIRLDEDIIERIDELIPYLQGNDRYPSVGSVVSRSKVHRVAILQGLKQLEKEAKEMNRQAFFKVVGNEEDGWGVSAEGGDAWACPDMETACALREVSASWASHTSRLPEKVTRATVRELEDGIATMNRVGMSMGVLAYRRVHRRMREAQDRLGKK